jgi:hypothetical protein
VPPRRGHPGCRARQCRPSRARHDRLRPGGSPRGARALGPGARVPLGRPGTQHDLGDDPQGCAAPGRSRQRRPRPRPRLRRHPRGLRLSRVGRPGAGRAGPRRVGAARRPGCADGPGRRLRSHDPHRHGGTWALSRAWVACHGGLRSVWRRACRRKILGPRRQPAGRRPRYRGEHGLGGDGIPRGRLVDQAAPSRMGGAVGDTGGRARSRRLHRPGDSARGAAGLLPCNPGRGTGYRETTEESRG